MSTPAGCEATRLEVATIIARHIEMMAHAQLDRARGDVGERERARGRLAAVADVWDAVGMSPGEV